MFELNGCPFCGGEVMVQESTWDKEPQAYTIECSTPKCPIDFCWFDTKEQAIEAWNDLLQGVHDEHQQAVIKVAVKAIDGIHCEADGMLSIKGQYCHHNGCTTVEVCGLCMIEHLKPHLKALKGLIDG